MKYYNNILLIIFLSGLIIISLIAYNSGQEYGRKIVAEAEKSAERILIDFNSENEIYCDGSVVSMKNGWTYNKENKIFTNNEKYINIYRCAKEFVK